jgi:hypothetical protein
MASTKRRKPYSEMSPAARIAEAEAAIARIRASMQGDNRFGSYGQSCRESIARWEAAIEQEAVKKGLRIGQPETGAIAGSHGRQSDSD